MSAPTAPARGRWAELGRFLEIQNLGLNLPFALGFLLVAARGPPSLRVFLLVVVAFVAARTAGHAFNRWADRSYDAQNPRTRDRALVTGRLSPRFALVLTALSATALVVAAGLLNTLALILAPVALALILGYSYTKRFTSATTVVLGVVEAITPAAAFVAVQARLPPEALLASVALLCWGTAFETVHSLGDLEMDRRMGLRSIPVRIGAGRSLLLVGLLHASALSLLLIFGALSGLAWPYFAFVGAMAAVVARVDLRLARHPNETGTAFQAHFVLSALFLAGVVGALLVV